MLFRVLFGWVFTILQFGLVQNGAWLAAIELKDLEVAPGIVFPDSFKKKKANEL